MKPSGFLYRHAGTIALVGCVIFLAGTIVSHRVRAQNAGATQNSGTATQSSPSTPQAPQSSTSQNTSSSTSQSSQPASQTSQSSTSQDTQPSASTTPAPTAQESLDAQFPDGEGKKEFLQLCGSCHDPTNVIGQGQNADGWTQEIYQMIQYGAQGSDQEFGEIVYYLSNNFGPPPAEVKINTATVMDLRNWLLFPQKQADAIVAYRKTHGDFKSIEDLEKVPGINVKMIEADKAKLTFSPSPTATQKGS